MDVAAIHVAEHVVGVDGASAGSDSTTRMAITPGLSDSATASTRTAAPTAANMAARSRAWAGRVRTL
ncbi:hypothetical protein BZL30_2868 [Mycobacterium kansasii]|uniref:Uncharacterized protein n=1 Tax=Mycobacterium kansasii TaxID=1768 RepID=A0A1V3XJH3_MYCKA|nr:hypothetical protein BZL30_2868 [Mycobacterium kansasii]